MRTTISFSTILLTILLAVAAAPSAHANAKRLAIVIGNEDYTTLPDVPHAKNDAQAMADFFRASGYDVFHRKDVGFFQMVETFGPRDGSEPRGHQLPQIYRRLARNADRLVIYFAGHGGPDANNDIYLLAKDSTKSVIDSWYPIDSIETHVDRLKAERGLKEVQYIYDACFTGESIGLGSRTIGRVVTQQDNGLVLSSTDGSSLSYPHPSAEHGAFTYYLLQGWRDGLAAQNGTIKASRLATWIEDRLYAAGRNQSPTVNRGFEDIILASKITPKPTRTPTPTPTYTPDQRLKGQGFKPLEATPVPQSLESTGSNPPSVSWKSSPSKEFSRKESRSGLRFTYIGKDDGGIAKYRWKLNDEPTTETIGLEVVVDDLPPGTHTLQVQAVDYDGATSRPLRHVFTVRGNEPPVAKIEQPSGDRAGGEKLRIKVGGTDPDGRVTTYRAAVGSQRNSQTNTDGEFTFEVAGGSQRIFAQVVDDEGAASPWVETRVEFVPGGAGGGGSAGQTKTFPLGNGASIEMVWIEPGRFLMGSPSSESGRDDDERQHRVTLTKGYWLGKYEVTQAQWRAVMGSNPSYFDNCGGNCPVEQVSWDDVQGFLRKVDSSFRLPTEAEWEYAARAGTTTRYSWGNNFDCRYANAENDVGSSEDMCVDALPAGVLRDGTGKVGSYPANAWGLYDMHGNVWEWCQDWYGSYPSGSVTDPSGSHSGSDRVARGGSWISDGGSCRSADRYGYTPDDRYGNLGFRLARSLP